jgi:peroxiredoxin
MTRQPVDQPGTCAGPGGGTRQVWQWQLWPPIIGLGLWAAAAASLAATPHYADVLGLQLTKEQVEAPAFSLRDLSGRTVALGDFRGRLVLVNFFATWCVPCREEMPALERLYRRYRDQGLVVLALSVRESAGEVGAFVQEFGLSFPVLLDGEAEAASRFGVRPIPATYLVGEDGTLRWRALGPRPWDGAEARAYFAQALAARKR